jgi:hypothetical protein
VSKTAPAIDPWSAGNSTTVTGQSCCRKAEAKSRVTATGMT